MGRFRVKLIKPKKKFSPPGAKGVQRTGGDIKVIRLDEITVDLSIQARVEMTDSVIEEYAAAMRRLEKFLPLVVFREGNTYRLADGFHRHAAALLAGKTEMECRVQRGGVREARLFAAGANAKHGLRRTNDDKRNAVMRLLEDSEWTKWSDRAIASHCRVGHQLVSKLRRLTGRATSEKKYRNKHGAVTTMATAKIGRAKSKSVPATEKALPAARKPSSLNEVETQGDPEKAHRDLVEFANLVTTSPIERKGDEITITISPADSWRFDKLMIKLHPAVSRSDKEFA